MRVTDFFNPEKVNRHLDFLFPPLARAVTDAIASAQSAGLRVAIFEGYRSPARSDWLFEQGRKRAGKIVTNAGAWSSWHNYGLAIDVAFLTENNEWTWEGDFHAVVPHFAKFGIDRPWESDAGHYQFAGGVTLALAKNLATKRGMQDLWANVMQSENFKNHLTGYFK